jgi:putative phage-type endonuclease
MIEVFDPAEMTQGSDAWHAWRKMGIGATDAAAICGYSKWDSALGVYARKTMPTEKSEPNAAQEWGTRIEPLLVDKLIDEMNLDPKRIRRGWMYADNWCKCSLDAEYLPSSPLTSTDKSYEQDHFVIECKTARDVTDWNPVPMGYYAQVQWQMYITGYRKAVFSVLANGIDWFSRTTTYDEQFVDSMKTRCLKFWVDLQNGIPPKRTPENPEADLNALATIAAARSKDRSSVEISEDLFFKYCVAKENLVKAQDLFNSIKVQIGYYLQQGDFVMYDGRKVASVVSRIGSETVDKKLLKEKYPDIYNKCIKRGMSCDYIKWLNVP